MFDVKEKRALDLSPAKWIWVPSARTLPNTFAKFKRKIVVDGEVVSAKGYVLGISRYLMTLNGKRIQWGPAPSDPRYEEADTVDLTNFLEAGENTLDILVCYFGHGEGTWVAGYPGLIYKIEIQYADGRSELVISDKETLAGFDNAHPAGQYKRWFLRALQEEYDAREEDNVVFENAMELRGFGKNTKRTWYSGRKFSSMDIVCMVICALLMLGSLLITFVNGSRYFNPFI